MEAYLSELVLKKHSEDRVKVEGLVNTPEEVPITITFFGRSTQLMLAIKKQSKSLEISRSRIMKSTRKKMLDG